MRIIKYFLVLSLFINYAFANQLSSSNEYQINFSSENIQKKKQEVLNLIKIESFKKIIKPLLINDQYKKFEITANIDLINTFIFSIDINEEKINNNNYSSIITIAFDRKKIINFFINNNINFIPYEPENFLLIIFDQKLFSEKILTKENAYYKYLLDNKEKYKYFDIPNLDINDRYIIKREDFLSKKIKNYDQLYEKYNNKNVVLIHSITALNKIEIFSYTYENDAFKIIGQISFEGNDFEKFFSNLEFKAIENWKYKNLVETNLSNKLNCRIKTLNLDELKKIKEIINTNNMIKQINTNQISYNNSVYELIFFGHIDILINSLNKNKIDLKLIDDECLISIL